MRQLLFLFCFYPFLLFAQSGGENTYISLQFPTSSRVAVLNEPIAIWGGDVDMGMYNPALLNPAMEEQLSLNFVDYFAQINMVSASYAFPFKEIGTMGVSLTTFSYGPFVATDEVGNSNGTFAANEQLLTTAFGKQIGKRFNLGGSVKMLLSNLESYQSFGLAADIGATYYQVDNHLAISFLAQNMGRQISTYTTAKESLPFQMKLGVSKRLEHLPFRFYLGYDHLEKFDLTYDSEIEYITDPITEEVETIQPHFGKKLFRHFVGGAELHLGKHIQLRMGYNSQRRKELKESTFLGMVGFSWGVGIKFSKFHLNYGRASYHLAGAPNYFSISTDISKIYHRK